MSLPRGHAHFHVGETEDLNRETHSQILSLNNAEKRISITFAL